MEDNNTNELYELFQRFCNQTPDTWIERIRALGLDTATESELLSLLETQTHTSSILDAPAFASLPNLAAIEPTMVDGFEIIRQLGSGGMGIVYLAEEVNLNRYVALKMLPSVLTITPNAAQRFQHEAQLAAQLDHPNIVKVHRFGQWQDTWYIASRYIEGETLAQALDRIRELGSDRRWRHNALEYVRSIARALDYAHQHDVIHRDVKPSNILIDANDAAHLADFGVATTSTSPEMTQAADTPGTLGYMSPEQAKLIDAPVGPQSDVFSLGAALFKCITLERFYADDSMGAKLTRSEDIQRVRLHTRNKALTGDLRLACLKALEWNPAHCYATAGDFAADLDRVIRGAPILAKKQPAHRKIAALCRRRRNQTIIGGSLVLGGLGLGIPMLLPDPLPTGRLIVTSTAPNSMISYQLFDNETRSYTEAVALGHDAVNTKMPSGFYRIAVRSPDGLAETSLGIEADETYTIAAAPTLASQATDEMILIPGGPALVGIRSSSKPALAMRTIDLKPFWIDRYEVTNAQYRQYVLATGADPPPLWSSPYDPQIDSLPVSGVTFQQAQDYAQWAGKRLPSEWEWERAARGADGRDYPWGNDFLAVDDPGNIGVPGSDAWSYDYENPELRELVFNHLRPANAQSGAVVTPEGALHFYGNVAEITSSPFVHFLPEGIPFLPEHMVAKGKHWNGESDGVSLLEGLFQTTPDISHGGVGFRCARSAE